MSVDLPTGTCVNCGISQATQWWVAEGGVTAFVHGCAQAWCERCCIVEQIRHCEEAKSRLPELRLKLIALTQT